MALSTVNWFKIGLLALLLFAVASVWAASEKEILDALAAEVYRPPWAPLPMFYGGTSALGMLKKLACSPDPKLRAKSAFLLGQIGSRDAVPTLLTLLHDPDRNVRVQAGIALGCLGDKRGVPACAAALGDAPSWVRSYAAYALWRVGSSRARQILQTRGMVGDSLVDPIVQNALRTPTLHLPEAKRMPPVEVPTSALWEEVVEIMSMEADWWWHRGNYDQAIRCLEVAVFFSLGFTEGYGSIAWLHWSMGRDDLAVRTLLRGVAASPSDADAYFELGYHYLNTGRPRLAEKPLQKAVELAGETRSRRVYAHCLERLGKLNQAMSQWEAIVRADESDKAASINLERVKKLAGLGSTNPKTD